MQVKIKEFAVEMELKNNGVELEVKDNEGAHLGDLIVTKAAVIWCKGRTQRAQGKRLTWQKFIELMDGQE